MKQYIISSGSNIIKFFQNGSYSLYSRRALNIFIKPFHKITEAIEAVTILKRTNPYLENEISIEEIGND